MVQAATINVQEKKQQKDFHAATCYHCGEDCPDNSCHFDDKVFCCNGCLSVYQLLNEAGLCTYYGLNSHAGINLRTKVRENKFAFLDDESIQQTLIQFRQDGQAHVTFYIPYIHCSSCIYLIENLHQLHEGVIRSDIQFLKKEVSIIFDERITSLRKVVETLTAVGYEPHISLQQMEYKKPKIRRSLIYRLGVAGFCFGNIMLLQFPEYLSSSPEQEAYLGNIFRYLAFFLALPVFFYSAGEFFGTAWKGLKHKHLNIDATVSLAIIATFARSISDVITGAGGGYWDSMSGIVFYMLVGRVIQDKTYGQLSFERDYTDYFPIAATVLKDDKEIPTPLPKIKVNDKLKIHNNELIPADGILIKGHAQIDYSFVTGEARPVIKEMGEIIYAGGKQLGGNIEIMTVKEVAQSYLTGLWNKDRSSNNTKENLEESSFVHSLARYFTWIVLGICGLAAIYWAFHHPSTIWTSTTAVLIIACPCALLMTATFSNGYMMRILGRNGLFLRNAHVIENFGKLNFLVFDKTGTLTSSQTISATYQGETLSEEDKNLIVSLASPTTHSMSKPVKKILQASMVHPVSHFKEYPGLGIEGIINGRRVEIGTASHLGIDNIIQYNQGTILYIMIDGKQKGYFEMQQGLRPGVDEMLQRLKQKVRCTLLSGDLPYQKKYFTTILGNDVELKFEQSPEGKLDYIIQKQKEKYIVGMIGDGLNDAGALRKSDVGICIAEDTNSFTPAGDAILEGNKLQVLDKLIRLCAKNKFVIRLCFGFSILYNITGIYFAVQGLLSPLIAAILMPCSTLTIVIISYFTSNALAKKYGLK